MRIIKKCGICQIKRKNAVNMASGVICVLNAKKTIKKGITPVNVPAKRAHGVTRFSGV